eukprot:jgi/Picre1/35313/NNA_002775.t1
MEAHALVARLTNQEENVQFPFLCLLVSGGHNLLLVVEELGRYVQLGTTLDDALGEAYDKIARLLDIDLIPSGGASVEKIAKSGDQSAYSFPVPLKKRRTCDFSFAGLKTSVRLAIEKEREACGILPETTKANIASSFQSVAVKHLDERVRRAFEWARETHPTSAIWLLQEALHQISTCAPACRMCAMTTMPPWSARLLLCVQTMVLWLRGQLLNAHGPTYHTSRKRWSFARWLPQT